MSTTEDVSESNIKPEGENENVERCSSSGYCGFSPKGLLVLGIIVMFLISTAISLGVGLHIVAAKKSGHHHRRAQAEPLIVDASLSSYVQPL